jgi:hypothetical protein
MTTELRCLSVWQPRASALALGINRYETRAWATRYREPIAIHAAKRWTGTEIAFHRSCAARLRQQGHSMADQYAVEPLPLGCIVAIADLVACWRVEEFPYRLDEAERMFGDFSPGRYAWHFSDMVRLPEPVPCRGHQGLWTLPREVADQVMNQMGGTA